MSRPSSKYFHVSTDNETDPSTEVSLDPKLFLEKENIKDDFKKPSSTVFKSRLLKNLDFRTYSKVFLNSKLRNDHSEEEEHTIKSRSSRKKKKCASSFLETISEKPPPSKNPVFQKVRPSTPIWSVALMQDILPIEEFQLISVPGGNIPVFPGVEEKPQVFKTPAVEGIPSVFFYYYPESEQIFMRKEGLHDLTDELKAMYEKFETKGSENLAENPVLKRKLDQNIFKEQIKRGKFEKGQVYSIANESITTPRPPTPKSPATQEIRPPTPVRCVALLQDVLPSRDFSLIPVPAGTFPQLTMLADKPQVFRTPAVEGVPSVFFHYYPKSDMLFMDKEKLHDLTNELRERRREFEKERLDLLAVMERGLDHSIKSR